MSRKTNYESPLAEMILVQVEQTVMTESGEYSDSNIDDLKNYDWI